MYCSGVRMRRGGSGAGATPPPPPPPHACLVEPPLVLAPKFVVSLYVLCWKLSSLSLKIGASLPIEKTHCILEKS